MSSELETRMQLLEQRSYAVGLYMYSAVLPTTYQVGTSISILPAPSGDMVVRGVNRRTRVLAEFLAPSVSPVVVRDTRDSGKISG